MRTPSYRYLWIFGLVLGVVLFTFPAGAQTWRQIGPQGGDVQSLAAVPGSARTLFLGTSDGHVFGSSDAGQHWELLGRIGANHDDVIMSIVVDARSAGTLYATSWTLSSHGGGVYRSADAGHNWQNGWPPITTGAASPTATLRLRPVAVEVTIELADWGVLVRHIEVAG